MNNLKAIASVVFWFTLSTMTFGDSPLEIKTRSGKVKGHAESTMIGKEVDAFLGIPYGAPADGRNRFGPPKEVEPWDGVLDATELPNPCYQIINAKLRAEVFANFVTSKEESENCLKLNIWIPKPRPKKSAVMVWIHGGAFALGSTDVPLYTGSNIAAQENIIVVSMNYRLSGFGFLYLGHPQAPGNVGLMDQALALQWVKNNIKAFGGDPEQITIFGESAGAASVGLHLLAPSSLDLFKNAILESGSGDSFWATYGPEDGLEHSLILAEKVGCPTKLDQREEIIRCLQDVNAEELTSAMITMDSNILRISFRPVVDGTFLPRSPRSLLDAGKFCTEKNILIGYNKEDGSFVLPFGPVRLEINENTLFTEEEILQVMSSTINVLKNVDGLKLDLVKHMYTDWDSYPLDRVAARTKLIHYLTDRWFACGTINTANKMSAKGNKVFLFRYDHISNNGLVQTPSWFGSSHAHELAYVFGHFLQNKEEDGKLSRQMMRYWANFGRNSDPNDEYLQVWPTFNSTEKLMLLLDGRGLTVARNDRSKECAFWQDVFPNLVDKIKDEF